MRLALPVTCDCGHTYKIDPRGVFPDTDLVCPKCRTIGHLDQSTINSVEEQFADAINEIDDDDIREMIHDQYFGVQARDVAIVVDDGMIS